MDWIGISERSSANTALKHSHSQGGWREQGEVGAKAKVKGIGLVGLAGRFGLEMEGVERSEDSTDVYTLRSDTFPATKSIKWRNQIGTSPSFFPAWS